MKKVKLCRLYYWFSGCMLLMVSCTYGHYRPTLEEVLQYRPALERVLSYCGDDTLKRRAAEFLLLNLPYYHSYSEKDMEAYLKVHEYYGVGTWYSVEQAKDSALRQYGRYTAVTTNPIPDLDISPDYLIDNIEWAFKVRDEQPWSKNVSFEDFCEYILPYRIEDECLKPWREKLYNKYNPMLDSIRYLPEAEDPLFVSRVLLDSISREESRFSTQLGYGPHVGPDLVDWVSGNCRELTDRLIYIFRAVGLPCGCDYMPLRGDGNVAHYWNFVFDKDRNSYYMYEKQPIGTAQDFYGARAKVYRQRFSLNRELQMTIKGELTDVYPKFRYPMYTDVTRLYGDELVHTITVPDAEFLVPVRSGEMLYLCHTSHMEWVPVVWSYRKKGGVTFREVEGRVVMCVCAYREGELIPVTVPFLLDKVSGAVTYYHEQETMEEVKLLNKYHQFHESFPQRMVGGVFEGSMFPDFRRSDTLHVITEMPLRLYNVIHLSGPKFYRYVRYKGPDNSYCNVAEVSFYEADSDTCYLKGRVIGTPNGKDGDWEHDYVNVYDGNPSTSFNHDEPDGGWSGLDLGRPRYISKIVYTARNRENYIYQGEVYELFYASGGQWHSMGKQIPTSDSLVYTVPKGALLYLKNHSGGVEERIFDYTDGVQRYW